MMLRGLHFVRVADAGPRVCASKGRAAIYSVPHGLHRGKIDRGERAGLDDELYNHDVPTPRSIRFQRMSRPQLTRRAAQPAVSFRTEADFVTALHKALVDVAVGARMSSEREVAAGRRIADLVLLLADSPASERAIADELSVGECVVLATLRRRGRLAQAALVEATGSSEGALRTTLQKLERRGFLTQTRTGKVSLVPSWTRSASLVAFEAKLHKWRDALAQARWYRKYADTSYVVLPIAQANAAMKASDEFLAAGVGLLVFDVTTLYLAIPAARSREHDWRREFVLSRVAQQPRSHGR